MRVSLFRSPTNASSSPSPTAVNVLADGLLMVMSATCPSTLDSIMACSGAASRGPLEEIDDGREILGAGARGAPHLVELLRHGAQDHRLLGQLGCIGGESEILEHEIRTEAAGVAARGGHVIHDPGVGVVGIRAPAPPARGVEDPCQHFRIDAES